MQLLVTGIDEQGRSCVVSRDPQPIPTGDPGIRLLDMLWETTEMPLPPRPAGRGLDHDLGVGPGAVRWMVLEFEPGSAFPMHHTDTIDFDTVLSGSLELVLDDGVHVMRPGDCAVIPGVDHASQAGPDGCVLSVVSLGTPPRPS